MKSGSLNDLNITLPQLPKEKLLANDFFGANINVYEVKKIDIHEDFKNFYDAFNYLRRHHDLAILTVAKPFDNETQKGELQTKSYEPKSKNCYTFLRLLPLLQLGKDTLYHVKKLSWSRFKQLYNKPDSTR